jgi:hypothetical protein
MVLKVFILWKASLFIELIYQNVPVVATHLLEFRHNAGLLWHIVSLLMKGFEHDYNRLVAFQSIWLNHHSVVNFLALNVTETFFRAQFSPSK